MAIQVHKRFFETREQVLDDIKKDGYWPTTLVTPVSPELPVHWHDSEVHGYVMSGRSWVLDGATGERLAMEPGDKLILPMGALHAEGDTTEPMVYIVALPAPRPFDQFLRLHPPEKAPSTHAAA
jgi:quercetin dioxygenase-like cupin family protein